jgi:hypothetical protein
MIPQLVNVSGIAFALVGRALQIPGMNAFLMTKKIILAAETGLAIFVITSERVMVNCFLLLPCPGRCARASAACGGS